MEFNASTRSLKTTFLDVELSPQRNVPEKYFDESGLNHEVISVNTPDQEKTNEDGIEFRYTDGNKLKPNNVDQYIGFQEINGRQDIIGSLDARPPTTVTIEKGTTYDIFVDQGVLVLVLIVEMITTLLFKKYFRIISEPAPQVIDQPGRTSPFRDTDFRMHDLIFGRACYVPATMIPWTHRELK